MDLRSPARRSLVCDRVALRFRLVGSLATNEGRPQGSSMAGAGLFHGLGYAHRRIGFAAALAWRTPFHLSHDRARDRDGRFRAPAGSRAADRHVALVSAAKFSTGGPPP